MKRLLTLGKHVLLKSLIQQYEAKGFIVDCREELSAEGIDINDFDELFVLATGDQDDKAVALTGLLASEYESSGQRLTCHLLVEHPETLQMLQTCDFCDAVRQHADIYPFTTDEMWSRNIVLDYEPITLQSEKHVHLVIAGMGSMAETVAIQAALTAHYPNYIRNHSLRTRLTMIDKEAERKGCELVRRYRHLFDNSYYRVVKPQEEKAVTLFHRPERHDFVDVEWEFVEAEIWNTDVREKLQLWATDSHQLLTVVLADEDRNMDKALLLPEELFKQQSQVYVYSRQEFHLTRLPHLHSIGMTDSGYDITLPLVRMAKNVNYIYDYCYHENIQKWNGRSSESRPARLDGRVVTDEDKVNGQLRYAVEIDGSKREQLWAGLPIVKRMSCIYNAMTIASKMRSVGLGEQEWERFYDIPQRDIEVLAQVEHNRWCVEELILGFRPCTEEEQRTVEADISQKAILKKRGIHYDLRAYDDLRPDETGKSVKIYDLCLCSCLPLIAKVFEEEGGCV